ncbi:MAG: glycosyltransferase family 2 protein [Gaiellales bacterium]
MSDETIAVIVPLFDGRETVAEAMISVLAQTRPPSEMILIDDGSSDDSLDVALAAIGEVPFPVKTIQQRNQGQSAARNAGVEATDCEFVAFLDQDDRWRHDHLEKLAHAITAHADIAWAYSDFNQIDATGQMVARRFRHLLRKRSNKSSIRDILMDDMYALPSASMLRRSALLDCDGFNVHLRGYEDDDLFVRMFSAGWRSAYVPEALVDYRVHGTSSSSSPHLWRSRVTFYEEMRDRYGDLTAAGEDAVLQLLRPRLMYSSMIEYSRALRNRRFDHARDISLTIRALFPVRHIGARRRIGFAILRRPRVARRLVLMTQSVPMARSILPRGLHIRR